MTILSGVVYYWGPGIRKITVWLQRAHYMIHYPYLIENTINWGVLIPLSVSYRSIIVLLYCLLILCGSLILMVKLG